MPTLLDVHQAAAAAAKTQRVATAAAATNRRQTARTARQALDAVTQALGAENARGDAIRAQLDDAPNPADAAVLVAQWEAHVATARGLSAAVLDVQFDAEAAVIQADTASNAAKAAQRHAEASAAALEAAKADAEQWTEWKAAAAAFSGNVLADRATALIASAYGPAKAALDARIPVALQAIAGTRQTAALDAIGVVATAASDAQTALTDHLATGGASDIAAVCANAFESARSALKTFSIDLESNLTAIEARLDAITNSAELSAAVLADIAAKTPGVPETEPAYTTQLNAWEAAVPDSAWFQLRTLTAAKRQLNRYAAATVGSADDPAEVANRFDTAEDAYALALQTAAAFEATRRERAHTAASARALHAARSGLANAFLLAALRGDR